MNAIATPRKIKPPQNLNRKPSPPAWRMLLLLFFLTTIITILMMKPYKGTDFIVEDEQGNISLSKERQKKLERRLKELDEAEQYALVASKSGYYPCYSCPNANKIYLLQYEVWKYGVTTKKLSGRYGKPYLEDRNLAYIKELEGTLQACLKEEQRKIYNYAILPENLKRDITLIRPPGNKVDN